jgi:hypothetical protein
MHIDAGIDTGAIIHQIRPRIFPGDGPHQIGNRLIADMAEVCAAIVRVFDRLTDMPQPPMPADERVYRKKDFSEEATRTLYRNFSSGMIATYLAEQGQRRAMVPILENPAVTAELAIA